MDKKKGKLKWIMLRRSMGILLAFVMVFSTLPISGIIVFASENQEAGLLQHHPIEDLLAALPNKVTEDNMADVREQLDEILGLYRELTEEEQEQIDISRCLELQEALDASYSPAVADASVKYRKAAWDESKSEVIYTEETAESCTLVGSDIRVWEDEGWYVVNGTVAIDEPITVNGAVNLILADGCTLDARSGIVVPENSSLTIYAQSDGSGTLNATGVMTETAEGYYISAGIGGSGTAPNSGKITIHGGIIHAVGGTGNERGAAGIGGGSLSAGNGGSSGAITIYGGTVTADSGAGTVTGAGIGGGAGDGSGGSGSNITIYDGSVTAESHGINVSGAGIGGGAGGSKSGGSGENIKIYGGMVNAAGGCFGAGIGGGGSGIGGTSGDGTGIAISGGKVTAAGSQYAAGIGGGGGYEYEMYGVTYTLTGGSGSGITITGGIVDASSPTDVYWQGYEGDAIGSGGNASGELGVAKTAGLIFQNTVGAVFGTVTLTEPFTVPDGYVISSFAKGAKIYGELNVPNAVAKAEKDGAAIGYYYGNTFTSAFAAENSGVKVTLLGDVEISSELAEGMMKIESGTFTLDLNGHNISSTDTAIWICGESRPDLTIFGSGRISGENAVCVSSGILTLQGGTFIGEEASGFGVLCNGSQAVLSVTGEDVSIENAGGGYGLYIGDVQSAMLSAGTYDSIMNTSSMAFADLPDKGCAYYKDGKPLAREGLGEWNDELSAAVLTDSVTVKKCGHEGIKPTSNDNGTHTLNCPCCGDIGEAEDCSYGEYTADDTSHTRTCTGCGYQKAEEHDWLSGIPIIIGNVTTNYKECQTCSHKWDYVDVTITLPDDLTYGKTENVTPIYTANPEQNFTSIQWQLCTFEESGGQISVEMDGNTLPADLPAGDYQLYFTGRLEDYTDLEGVLHFTVASAPLTADMVQLSETEFTYNGTEQKPTLTIGKGETTLTEGTDYELSYTRDGAVTTDFTSAGTVMATIIGKGNYKGEVKKSFIIEQAEPDVGTVTAQALENTLDVSQVAFDRTNQMPDGKLTLTESTLKYGTNTYTWKFTPNDAVNYKTVIGTVQITVNDTIAPTGEISVETNKWNSFLNTITFGLFFKQEEQVTITAEDKESGVASVLYYISDSRLTEEEVKTLDNWTDGNTDKTTFSVSQKESCVIYAKITDYQGNAAYISSDGLVFDETFPSIIGVTDGETYCTPQTVTVTDDNLKSVTVNGKEEILSDGKFTLGAAVGEQIIEAADKAGNVTTVTVKVNAGHDYGTEWKSDASSHWHECNCGEKTDTASHTEDGGSVTKAPTETEKGVRTYHCSVCGYVMRTEEIEKLPAAHTHSYSTEWKSNASSHWHECICGEKSESASHTEDSGSVTKAPTETEKGIRTYHCSICGYVMRTEEIGKLPPTSTEKPGQTQNQKPTPEEEQPQETVTSEKVREGSEKLDSGLSIGWTGNKFALSWEEVDGAEGYDIFAALSGKKMSAKSLMMTAGGKKTSVTFAKIAGRKISIKKVYQIQIKAFRYVNGKKVSIGCSRVYHVAGKANPKYTNAKKLKPAKKKYVLKKGKSVRMQVKVVKQAKKKKLLPKSYGPALWYSSSDKNIAAVTQKGIVKAKTKGTCTITVTALNGTKAKIKITVK